MEVEFKPVKLTPTKWKIYNQNKMIIKGKEIKIISLGFGVEMSSGTTSVSIKPELKQKCCIIVDGIFLK